MYENDDTSWSFGIGLFIGALAGAALASLYTPRRGAQNREVVLEKGIVLKERVLGASSSVATTVKDTTSSAVSSVMDTTNSAVSKVSDTVSTVREKASAAAETVTDAAGTAVSKVSGTAATTVEKLQDAASVAAERVSDAASTASEKVSAAASTASEKVSAAASTASEKVSSAASTATEKARSLTGRTPDSDTTAMPTTRELASEARYDAEEVRPAMAGAGSSASSTTRGTSASTEPLHVLSSLDTFEPTMADVTAATTIDPTVGQQSDQATDTSTAGVYNSQFGGATELRSNQPPSAAAAPPAELRSDEQFEVTDLSTGQPGASFDVREASEGAERGA